MGHISTRQIQRLLDEAAEKAGLQETRSGNVRQRKMIKRQFTCGLDRTIEERHMKRQVLINCSIHVDDSFSNRIICIDYLLKRLIDKLIYR